MLNDILVTFRVKADDKKLALHCEFEAGLPLIPGNAETLQEAFEHLLNNALFFTREGGSITLRTYRHDNNLMLNVSDTGIGIPESDLSLIFDRFYKVDQARPLTTGGAGMGLAITKRIVELHHGSIEVESVMGKGSTFHIILPLNANTANGDPR